MFFRIGNALTGMKETKIFIYPMLMAILTWGCSGDDPETPPGNGGPPPVNSKICKVQEMEFRNNQDEITGIRNFNYNVNQNNRIESISIVERLDLDPISLRFEFRYTGNEIIPASIDEIFGPDILTTTEFKFDLKGNLSEFIRFELAPPYTGLPESHIFFYEASEKANDSINARIITFDIDRLTRNWIDVLPAIFTTGGQRITRFEVINFRGDLLNFCDISYNEQGNLEGIVCRRIDGILSEVWDFTYQNNRLVSAFEQLPNFRAITDYEYDDNGKPSSVVSTTDGRFNWTANYFYICR